MGLSTSDNLLKEAFSKPVTTVVQLHFRRETTGEKAWVARLLTNEHGLVKEHDCFSPLPRMCLRLHERHKSISPEEGRRAEHGQAAVYAIVKETCLSETGVELKRPRADSPREFGQMKQL